MHKAEEVFDVVFPSSNEAAEVVHPDEEPLDFPLPAITAQLAAAAVGRDHQPHR